VGILTVIERPGVHAVLLLLLLLLLTRILFINRIAAASACHDAIRRQFTTGNS